MWCGSRIATAAPERTRHESLVADRNAALRRRLDAGQGGEGQRRLAEADFEEKDHQQGRQELEGKNHGIATVRGTGCSRSGTGCSPSYIDPGIRSAQEG